MAIKAYDRNIFGRKIDAPQKLVRTLPAPTAVTAMNEIAAICEQTLTAFFDENGVKEGYRNIIMVLGKEDGISQLTIASGTNLKPSTVSIALKKMEREGYITRTNDIKDMRMSRVYLTEEGRIIADRAYKVVEDFENTLLGGISKDDLETVMDVAEKMKANLEKGKTE